MHLGRLVGAVLAPHDGIHRELGVGRSPGGDLLDPRVLVVLQPELGKRLLDVGVPGAVVDGFVRSSHTATKDLRTEANIARPSVPGPVRSSMACSGCGIRPTTLPASLRMPAMSRRLPLGLLPT